MATNTSASSTTHTGNGTAGPFSISFNYLDEDEIDVTVDGALKTLTTHYTFPSASTISFTSGNHPTNGAAIKFQRDTNISSKKVDFQDGSVLTEADLDNNTNQILYGLQEFVDLINDGVVRRDGTLPMTGDLQMDVGRSIIFEGATADAHETTLSVADPTADRTVTLPNTTGTVVTTGDTGTVTSTMLADGTIATGDLANNSVTTAKIVDDAVTGAKIADNAITSAHIADGTVVAADIGANAVTASELADDAVDTAAIANSAVTNAKLGADAVNGSKIADDAINSEHYVDGSIDTAHIADSQITAAKLASNAVTTAKINADAVDGTKIADDSINSEHYVDGSIDTAHIADSQVTTAKIADDAVTAAKIADGSITSAHIAADTVVAADIAANAITASELADNAVDTAAIADNAVTNAKMADDSVTASEIAANAVGASELADNAVDTAAIAADAVTGAKIADDAINSEHYTDGSIDTAHIADAQITTAKLADDAVTAAKVGTFNLADLTNVHTATPNDGQVLKWVNSNSRWEPAADAQGSVTDGDYGEITVSSSGSAFTIDNGVVTTAKIADDAITGAKLSNNLDIPDSNTIRFGTGNDLQIYHDGSHNKIAASNGNIHVETGGTIELNKGTSEYLGKFVSDGAVELYYDNAKKAETASWGLNVLGNCGVGDSSKFQCGDSQDLQIYHDGNNSRIVDSGTGNLILQGSRIVLNNADSSENMVTADENGAVELYYDNSKKLETTSNGVKAHGKLFVEGTYPRIALTDTDNNSDFSIYNADGAFMIYDDTNSASRFTINSSGIGSFNYGLEVSSYVNLTDNSKVQLGTSQDLQIYHNGSHSYIRNDTGLLHIDNYDGDIKIRPADGDTGIKVVSNGGVELYYDNSKKFETTSTGATVTGSLSLGSGDLTLTGNVDLEDSTGSGNNRIKLGTGDDLEIYHNGTSNIILANSGDLNIRTNNSENSIVARQNGSAELYYDNSKKLETTSDGVKVTGDFTVTGLGGGADFWWDNSGNQLTLTDDRKIRFGDSGDLQIYHNGTYSYITNSTGFLEFRSADYIWDSSDGSATYMKAMGSGAVELYYDGVKKAQTYANGLELIQNLYMQSGGQYLSDNVKIHLGNSNDFTIYHDGSNSYIENATGDLYIKTSTGDDIIIQSADDIYLQPQASEDGVSIIGDGAVKLYYDGSKKLETTSSGVTVTGTVTETSDIALKHNINTIQNPLDLIEQIRGINFTWKTNGMKSMGVIAQDVEKVFPELVHGNEGSKSLQYSGLIGALVESVKELSAKVAALESA